MAKDLELTEEINKLNGQILELQDEVKFHKSEPESKEKSDNEETDKFKIVEACRPLISSLCV